MMINIVVKYHDLSFEVRKGLAARHELLEAARELLEQSSPMIRADVARSRDSALKMITMPIRSADNERLDSYLRRVVAGAALSSETHPRILSVSCARCTGKEDAVCDGGSDDSSYVRALGECVDVLKSACDLAIAAMLALYGEQAAHPSMTSDANVHLVVDSECADGAAANFCIGGKSDYEKNSDVHVTTVSIRLGLKHWTHDSYAALALVLAHELICHAGFGLSIPARERTRTSESDRFIEGWMDLVAREAVVRQLAAAQTSQVSAAGRHWKKRIDEVHGALTVWRNSEKWAGPCRPKEKDWVAHDRRVGGNQARAAARLFAQILSNDAYETFVSFSTAFNAAGVSDDIREALIDEVQAISSLLGDNSKHPLFEVFAEYAAQRKIAVVLRHLEDRVQIDA